MHDDVRSQNLYVYSILALGNENQTVSDSGQAENLKGKKRVGKKDGRGRAVRVVHGALYTSGY
jgi:hypothetical protein